MFRGPVGKGFGPAYLLAWPSGGIPVETNLPCLRLSMYGSFRKAEIANGSKRARRGHGPTTRATIAQLLLMG